MINGELGRNRADTGDVKGGEKAFEAAIADFDRVLKQAPDLDDVRLRRAGAAAEIGDFTAAIAETSDLIERALDPVDALILRASCQRTLGMVKEAEADLDHAITLLDRREGDDPRLMGALTFRSGDRRARGDSRGAIGDLQRAIGLEPTQIDLHRRLGMLLESEGQLKDALTAYQRVIDLGYRSPDAYRDRADVLAEMERYDEALKDYTRVIDLAPNDVMAYVGRADIYMGLDDPEAALTDLSRAIEADPTMPGLFGLRGMIALALGSYQEAISDLDRAIKEGDISAETYVSRGEALISVGEPRKANRDFGRAIELDASNADAYLGRGRATLEQRPDNQAAAELALRDFDTTLALDPKRADGYLSRADAHAALGHDERAKSDYERAIELDKSDTQAHRGLIWALFRMGDERIDRRQFGSARRKYEKALHTAEAAQSIDGDDASFDYLRAIALRVLEGYDLAVDAARDGLRKTDPDDIAIRPWLYREQIDALRLWGEMLHMPERLEQALDAWSAARKGDTGAAGPTLHELGGHTLLALGRLKQAVAEYDKAIKLERASGPEEFDATWSRLGRSQGIPEGRRRSKRQDRRPSRGTVVAGQANHACMGSCGPGRGARTTGRCRGSTCRFRVGPELRAARRGVPRAGREVRILRGPCSCRAGPSPRFGARAQ